jgi:extracellular elastinolytic metalloproteinase
MIRSIESRNYNINRATDARMDELTSVASTLPDENRVSIPALNSFTGTPNRLVPDSTPSATKESLIDQALDYVNATSAAFGFTSNEPAEFVPDPTVATTSSGSSAVNLQQTYRGIPVFEMIRTVRFSPNKDISDVVGDNINLPPGINIAPQINAAQAVMVAAQSLADPSNETEAMTDSWGQPRTPIRVDISGYNPQVLVTFPLPSKPTVLEKAPFADSISAYLVLFYQNPGVRLGWFIQITMPNQQNQYDVIVSADSSEPTILYSQSLIDMVIAEGNVYHENPSKTPRKMISFPCDLDHYPISKPDSLPSHFPGHWCADSPIPPLSIGNNTIASLWEEKPSGRQLEIKKFQGEKTQNGKIMFNPSDPEGDEQKILNIFYLCNYMHDFFWLLGFTEETGNFQEINYSSNALAGDPVDARAFRGGVYGTANMLTLRDGIKPIMNMGAVTTPTDTRHTAFDADVVFHEFVHGVTNRLVGGRMNSPGGLRQPQSQSMGEGWGDYFALTIQNFDKPVEKVVMGDWVTSNPDGIRGLKYDSNFPDHFGNIGTGRYREVHNIGEPWCAVLMEMNRNIGAVLGSKDRGHQLGWQIVVDGLKLSPSNPSFLDGRDAILRALDGLHMVEKLDDADYSGVKKGVWTAFAKFGMGPGADCIRASLNGIVADFSVPTGL